MKKFILTNIIAGLFGFLLASNIFVNAFLGAAIGYFKTAKMVFMADSFNDAHFAHNYAALDNHHSLEESAAKKMFKFAQTSDQYLLTSKVASNDELQKKAIEKAAYLTVWTSYWPSHDENCNRRKFKKTKRGRVDACISLDDLRQEILAISKRYAPDTYNKSIDTILLSTDPVSLGNFAEVFSDVYKDDTDLQKKVEIKLMAIPATSVTLKEWAKVRSTEPIEIIVANKMAEASTTTTDLILAHPRLRYGTALNITITAIKKKSNADDCLVMLEGDILNYEDSFLYREVKRHCQNMEMASRHNLIRKKH